MNGITDLDIFPTPPTVTHSYRDAASAFDAGNYVLACVLAGVDAELTAAAAIMCGAVAPGIDALRQMAPLSARSRLALAYGNWCLGDDQAAIASLNGGAESDPDSTKLKQFIEGGPLDVLVFTMPGSAKAVEFETAKGFNLHVVSLEPAQFGIPMADVMAALPQGFDPVFVLSVDAYGPYLPKGFFDASIPTVLWASDHDYFVASRSADFERADVVIVNGAAEQAEMTDIYETRIVTLPGHEFYDAPPAGSAPIDRDCDVRFTGRAFVPYMRDKAQYLFQLATLEDPALRIEIVDGYLDNSRYRTALASARFIPIHCRYAASVQTRAIDAFFAGANVLSPEENLIGDLMGGENGGYISLAGADADDVLARLAHGHDAKPDPSVLSDFLWSSPQRETRFLKFALLQTLLAGPRQKPAEESQVGAVEFRGYEPSRGIAIYTRLASLNLEEVGDEAAPAIRAAAAAFYAAMAAHDNQRLTQMTYDLHRSCADRFPQSLVAQFNAGCALSALGAAAEAVEYFSTVAEKGDALTFNPRRDALLSHRIRPMAAALPYEDYYWAVTRGLRAGDAMCADARRILQATARFYLGRQKVTAGDSAGARQDLKAAVELFPDHFPAWAALVPLCAEMGAAPEETWHACSRAIALYPPNLKNLLPFAVDALSALGRELDADQLTRWWVLLADRVRSPEGKRVMMQPDSLNTAIARQANLDAWIAEIVNHMVKEDA